MHLYYLCTHVIKTMIMKKTVLTSLALVMALTVQADDYPYLTFETVDGTKTSVSSTALTITIQNGKLIGAVTHVLVRDPTRGYGILIGHMLDAAEGEAEEAPAAEAPAEEPAAEAAPAEEAAAPAEAEAPAEEAKEE